MKGRLLLLLVAVACTASESERAQSVAERRQAREAVLASEIVQAAKTPTTSGRLIYDPPTDLQLDSVRIRPPR